MKEYIVKLLVDDDITENDIDILISCGSSYTLIDIENYDVKMSEK